MNLPHRPDTDYPSSPVTGHREPLEIEEGTGAGGRNPSSGAFVAFGRRSANDRGRLGQETPFYREDLCLPGR